MPSNRRIKHKTKKRFKKAWDNVVKGLGRQIVVYLQDTRNECPNCYYDKVHDKSSGVPKVESSAPTYFTHGRCPVCNGKGVVVTSRKRCIDGIVIWNPQGNANNTLTFSEAGMEGVTSVEIKTDVCYLDVLKQSKHTVIDGVRCKLSNPPIIRGIGGKDLLVASFVTMDKPNVDSGEYVH